MNNLTGKEKKVLAYINEVYQKKIRLTINVEKVAHACDLSEIECAEILKRINEKGLIKERKGRFYWGGKMTLEVLLEMLAAS